jgi:sortase A
LFGEDTPLLKVGVVMMALAVVLVIGAAVASVALRSEPGRALAGVVAQGSQEDPQRHSSSGEGQGAAKKSSGRDESSRYSSEKHSLRHGSSSPSGGQVGQRKAAETTQRDQASQEENTLPAGEYDWQKPTKREVGAANSPRQYQLLPGAIMGLTIRAIGIYDAPVFDSDSRWALASGVAHTPQTSLPWSPTPQRNVYLSGHRMGFRGTWSRMLFYNLDELKEGDKIVLKDRLGHAYRYEVSEIFLAEPTDSWVMGQVRGRDMVTLQTCTPIPTFEKRLIVRADRV